MPLPKRSLRRYCEDCLVVTGYLGTAGIIAAMDFPAQLNTLRLAKWAQQVMNVEGKEIATARAKITAIAEFRSRKRREPECEWPSRSSLSQHNSREALSALTPGQGQA